MRSPSAYLLRKDARSGDVTLKKRSTLLLLAAAVFGGFAVYQFQQQRDHSAPRPSRVVAIVLPPSPLASPSSPPEILTPPEARDDTGGVGRRLGPRGVFPRARPRIVHNILFTPNHCQEKVEYVRHLGGSAVVVEVGAFHGEEISPFKGLVKRLHTYEPSSSKFNSIKAAIKNAGMDDVVTFRPVAASDVDGEATLQMAKAEGTQQDSLGEIGFM